MARNMVTRLVKGTEAEVKVINTNSDEISVEKIVLSKPYTEDTEAQLKKAVAKHYEDTDFTVVKIINYTPVNKLYGVSQAVFMANAVELDPVTRKVLATGEDTTEDDDTLEDDAE